MNILILGAAGQIARVATRELLARTDADLTLYARNIARLTPQPRTRIVEGDVLDATTLAQAMAGQDLVYANLSGDMEPQARAIVTAMQAAGVGRVIFIASMGIYDEVPGESHGAILDPYRNSARVIEGSGLDYAIIRPAWLNDRDEIAYATTGKGQPFENAGASVSRRSVADLIVRLAEQPRLGNVSLGVHHS
ncbi:MAG: NAD(P)H-binding protein [Paracoccus sp. (in: a-proteobacteria)]|uniref:NAD(P)H-binding protein n=1 Tax=Paracoccus sp. TaxID=267 RepID=UPI0026DFCC82|nr:NAD(P)H-binding protein [Paracoccus sp. (in: a-proteobacteria)]MDO5612922.1 NAD(P)H-binding protein [Paracoccus sp. (in: a-proteobacteria)]